MKNPVPMPESPNIAEDEVDAAKAGLRRQSLALRDDPNEREVTDWIAGIVDVEGWS